MIAELARDLLVCRKLIAGPVTVCLPIHEGNIASRLNLTRGSMAIVINARVFCPQPQISCGFVGF